MVKLGQLRVRGRQPVQVQIVKYKILGTGTFEEFQNKVQDIPNNRCRIIRMVMDLIVYEADFLITLITNQRSRISIWVRTCFRILILKSCNFSQNRGWSSNQDGCQDVTFKVSILTKAFHLEQYGILGAQSYKQSTRLMFITETSLTIAGKTCKQLVRSQASTRQMHSPKSSCVISCFCFYTNSYLPQDYNAKKFLHST